MSSSVGVSRESLFMLYILFLCLSLSMIDFVCLHVTGWNDFGQLGLKDSNNRGDEPQEMGDNLSELIKPTQDPTMDPTKQPTTICEPYESCTECVGVNSVVPDCFWHVSHQECYHYNEVTNYDPTQFCISCHKLVSSSISEWSLIL